MGRQAEYKRNRRKYSLSIKANQLYKYIEPLVTSDLCPHCNKPMVLLKRNRVPRNYKNPLTCLACKHQEKIYCKCEGCERNREKAKQDQCNITRKTLLSTNNKSKGQIIFSDLSFNMQLIIASTILSLYDISLAGFTTLRKAISVIAPSVEASIAHLKILHYCGYIQIAGFDESESNGDTTHLDYQNIIFTLDMVPNVSVLYDTICSNELGLDIPYEEIQSFERSVLMQEIYELISYNMQTVGFAYIPGDKTRALVEKLISKYSYFQIASILYNVTNRTLRYVKEYSITKKHAYNIFIHNLNNYIQHAAEAQWTIRNSFRPRECPISAARLLVDQLKLYHSESKSECTM